MYTGGDGYTALAGGIDVQQPGDGLLEITIEYIAANSPVGPVVEGRITRADLTTPSSMAGPRPYRGERGDPIDQRR